MTSYEDVSSHLGHLQTAKRHYKVFHGKMLHCPHLYSLHYVLTFALLGGVWTPPLRFFADSKKTAARSAAGFSPTLSPIFLATFVKVSILGHARSGHQVRSSDHTLQKLYNRAPATVFEGKLWNFRNMIRSSVPTKCISWIFDIGDLRSGHFRDLPIISQWAKIKLPVLCFILSLYEWNRIRYGIYWYSKWNF